MNRALPVRFRRPGRAARRRAFTLIEVIVVVTIIALLAGLIIPRIWNRVADAKKSKALADSAQIRHVITLYLMDEGLSGIGDDFDIAVLRRRPDDGGGAKGPYLNKDDDLLDPWGTPFSLRIPGEINEDFDVICAGQDKQFNNEDDIVN